MTPKMLTPLLALALLAACGGSGTPEPQNQMQNEAGVSAVVANAADSIRTRQQHYKQIGRAMKTIADELKKEAPDVAAIQAGAATIDRLAPQIRGWFPEGTGTEAGIETEAKAEIWSKPEQFRQAAQRLAEAAAQFHATAESGDIAAIREGVKTLGGACKNCHDQFRAEKD